MATFSVSSFAIGPYEMNNYSECCSSPPTNDGNTCGAAASIVACGENPVPLIASPALELDLIEVEYYQGDSIIINGVTYKRVKKLEKAF